MRKIAVCSWSYRMSAAQVAREMEKCSVKLVHLAVNPFVDPLAVVPGTAGEIGNVGGTGGVDPIGKQRDDIEELLASGKWQVSSTLFNSRYDDYSTAVKILAPWIRHVHIKDANRSKVPGQWGEEVEGTKGEVDADAFLAALDAIGFGGALAVEREAGDDRAGDIAAAVADLKRRI
jgi:hypothetical protein